MGIRLTPRLLTAANMVNANRELVDIGTDHAYLPVYLIEQGITQSALACDINPNPLKNAKITIDKANLSEQIELRISDGLDNVSENEAEEIVIAGMGGLMIADIIERTSWLKNADKHLVLQPMTHAEDVRAALFSNGFRIDKETACNESRHVYLILSAYYDGETREATPLKCTLGKIRSQDSKAAARYVRLLTERLTKKAEAQRQAGLDTRETEMLLKEIAHADSI